MGADRWGHVREDIEKRRLTNRILELLHSQELGEAETVLKTISDLKERSRVAGQLAIECAKIGRYDDCLRIARAIYVERAENLLAIMKVLVQAKQKEHFLALLPSLTNTGDVALNVARLLGALYPEAIADLTTFLKSGYVEHQRREDNSLLTKAPMHPPNTLEQRIPSHELIQWAFPLIRQMAFLFYQEKAYAKAEELLTALLEAGFEPSCTRHHLARVCFTTDRFVEAREHVAQGWANRSGAKPYIIARLVWFQYALEILAERSAEEKKRNGDLILGRLKTVLQTNDACMEWTMQPVIDHLHPKLEPQNAKLLSALVAALNDRTKLPELEYFPEWREAKLEPLE